MVETRNVIVELLSQFGGSREARAYLQRFSSVERTEFAVIKVGGGVLAEELDQLAWALTFLHRVGLSPIVLHGAGPQLNRALVEAGIETPVINGLRVTSPEAMAVVRPVVYEQNARLVDALEARGVRARGLLHGVFEARSIDEEKLGLVGEIERVRIETLTSAIGNGALPIVASLGETPAGQMLNINADVAAGALVRAIKPYKVVFLTPTGGLLDQDGRIISAINLVTDYEALMAADWVHSGMRLKLQQIAALLDDLPRASSVSITSAEHLTRELFTHTGCGTLIRRGERFLIEKRVGSEAQAALSALLEQCFQKPLRPGYWAGLTLQALIRAESNRAVAVVVEGLDGESYLDKFAVTPEAQGEGLGAALWSELKRDFPRLYWRSRADNPVNSWYFRQSDAALRQGHWRVFAYGIDDGARLMACARDAAAREESWRPS